MTITDLSDLHLDDEIRVELPNQTLTGSVHLVPMAGDNARFMGEDGVEHTLTQVDDGEIIISTTADEEFVDEIEITEWAV